MNTVDTFLFDLGWVFVDYDPMIAVRRFCREAKGSDERKVLQLLFGSELHRRFERGLISAGDFHQAVQKGLDTAFPFPRFKAYWQEIFHPIQPMIETLDVFSGRFRLGLVSNTNVLHLEYLKTTYGFWTI
jgi:FMN phosphatase YigB (HAD superfamily)